MALDLIQEQRNRRGSGQSPKKGTEQCSVRTTGHWSEAQSSHLHWAVVKRCASLKLFFQAAFRMNWHPPFHTKGADLREVKSIVMQLESNTAEI